jgi:hypothetical protein
MEFDIWRETIPFHENYSMFKTMNKKECSSVVEHLTSMNKVLVLISNTTLKKKSQCKSTLQVRYNISR